MTLIYGLDLYLLKMQAYFIPKMNFLGQSFRKLERYEQTDRQTDATARTITRPFVNLSALQLQRCKNQLRIKYSAKLMAQ